MRFKEFLLFEDASEHEFQVKTHGDWRDMKLPAKDLAHIEELVKKYGKNGKNPRLSFLGDLVRDNWGKAAFRDKDGKVTDKLMTKPIRGEEYPDHELRLQKFSVISHSDDVLKLELGYSLLRRRGGPDAPLKLEKKGTIPATIMPGA